MVPVKKPEQRDLFRGALEMMILESLRRQPMHGYALVQHIKQQSHDLLQVEEGSLYPALQRMLLKGWVTASGDTAFALRLLSAFFGVLIVPLTYILARRLYRRPE